MGGGVDGGIQVRGAWHFRHAHNSRTNLQIALGAKPRVDESNSQRNVGLRYSWVVVVNK